MFDRIKNFVFGEEIEIIEEETPLEEAYDELSRQLKEAVTAKDTARANDILYTMSKLKELMDPEEVETQAPEKKPFVSGDTLAKIGAAGVLAGVGYKLETSGHILPKSFQIGNLSTMMKL